MSEDAKPVKGKLLCEGKTKQIYENEKNGKEVVVLNKDRITAHNDKVAHQLKGKAQCSNITNERIFTYLNDAGIKTSFIAGIDDNSYRARRCTMIPLEWVTRRIATGSFLRRNPGVMEGYRFTPVKLETFYKDDAADDPEWSKAQVLSIPLDVLEGVPVSESQYRTMAETTVVVFEVLERAWAACGCTLVDMKVEFGIDCVNGQIVLSDVIDNDSWRLWEGGKKELMKDKQVYRNLKDCTEEDLKKIKLNYDWVMDKLTDFQKGVACTVVLIMGSPSDDAIARKIDFYCQKLGLNFVKRIMSAHKVTEQTLQTLQYYNSMSAPVVYIAVAGRSNGLGPVMAGNTTLPVINCPPINLKESTHDIWSSLNVPSGLGCSTVIYPETAALSAASTFAVSDHRVWSKLRAAQLERTLALDKADQDIQIA